MNASAQDGLALLQSEAGAGPAGMAGAVVSLPGSPDAVAYNPAASVGATKFSFSFGHNEYWENIRIEDLHMIAPLTTKLSLHSGLRLSSVDNIEERTTATTEPDALFESRDISFKAGASYMISKKLSAGLTLGYISEKLSSFQGGTFSFDVGAIYKYSEKISLGASAVNVGSNFRLKEGDDLFESKELSLPTIYRLGGSYRLRDYLAALDFVILDDEVRANLGAQWQIREEFAIRSGYMANFDSKSFSAGASFMKRNFTFDYAFIPFSNSLGTSHQFSLIIQL